MLDRLETHTRKLIKIFNEISAWGIVLAMLLVIVNILLRVLFKKPLLGTYEFTGFITASVVGFGLAYCLLNDAHIFIDFVTNKFNDRVQGIINIVTGTFSFILLLAFTYFMFRYAGQLVTSNSVSQTTQFPFYIVVYLIAICFIMLDLGILIKIREYAKDVAAYES